MVSVELPLISFEDAKLETATKRRHALLGNGFSIAVHSGFSYSRLYDEARRHRPEIIPLFEGHGADFERALGACATTEDRDRIREAFIKAISITHPRHKYLSPDAPVACGRFLEVFAGLSRGQHRGSVFTTNYDLLLYWVLMKRKDSLKMYDGTDRYGVWAPERVHNSFVYYLHGALHLYEAPVGNFGKATEQRKLMGRAEAGLIDQVRASVDKGRFPTIVSEGSHEEKKARIGRNAYLRRISKRFVEVCDDPETALFVVGHSLGRVDQHITDKIGAGKASVYIGVHSKDDELRAREVVAEWERTRERDRWPPLAVRIFKSAECEIWGERANP